MTRAEFAALLGSHGVNIERWPEELRTVAPALFDACPDLVAEAAALDEALDQYTVAAVDKGLADRIARSVATAHIRTPARNRYVPLFRYAALVAIFVMAGFWFGHVTAQTGTVAAGEESTMYTLLYGATSVDEVLL